MATRSATAERLKEAEELIEEILDNISAGYNRALWLRLKEFLSEKEW